MITLLPSNPKAYGKFYDPDLCGWLLTPRRSMSTIKEVLHVWAADNECYTLGDKFDFERYIRFLHRVNKYPGRCLFVTVPDKVGDSTETRQRWEEMSPRIREAGLPLAYVAQDGMKELPNVNFDSLFIGGSTEYKLSQEVARLIETAHDRGKWVHIGRVNTIKRIQHFQRLKADSFDGTCLAMNPMRHIRWIIPELRRHTLQLPMKGI